MSSTSAKNVVEDHGAGDAAAGPPAVGSPVGSRDPSATGRTSTRSQLVTTQRPASETPSQPGARQALGNFFQGLTSSDPEPELQTKYRKLKAENQELTAKNQELTAKIRELTAKNQELIPENKELRAEKEQLVGTNQGLWGWCQALDREKEQLTKAQELRGREHAIELDEKRAQLKQKDDELVELRRSLCMYDEYSEADITKMVEGINTKIQSVSRNVAGRWIREASNPSDGGVDAEPVTEREAANLSGIVGVQLVKALYASTPGQTTYASLFLQVAWNASIVATVTKIMSSFSARLNCTPGGQNVDTTLRNISDKVVTGELQPAYGRWRLITHRYLEQVFTDGEQAIKFYGDEALGHCRIASRLILKNRCPDAHVFVTTFDAKMKEIVADALKLRTILQEKVTTTNFEPYTLKQDSLFRAEHMEVGKQDKEFQHDRVICITGLGLWQWGKKGRENTSELPEKSIFKKVQVLTEGNLNDMIAGV